MSHTQITLQGLADLLLAYAGKTVLTADAVQKLSAVETINGALADIHEARADLFKRSLPVQLHGAQNGTVDVTQGSATLANLSFSAFTPPDGSTVYIAGDAGMNEIYTAGSTKTLLFPYTGPTAAGQAITIYGDTYVLPSDYMRFSGPIVADDGLRPLPVLTSREQMAKWERYMGGDYGSTLGRRARRQPGCPEAVWVESWSPTEATVHNYRMRFLPLPNRDYRVRVDVITAPQTFATSDLTAPDTVFRLPPGLDRSVLVPFAMQAWTSSPLWNTERSTREIVRRYNEARATLEAVRPISGAHPQIEGIR